MMSRDAQGRPYDEILELGCCRNIASCDSPPDAEEEDSSSHSDATSPFTPPDASLDSFDDVFHDRFHFPVTEGLRSLRLDELGDSVPFDKRITASFSTDTKHCTKGKRKPARDDPKPKTVGFKKKFKMKGSESSATGIKTGIIVPSATVSYHDVHRQQLSDNFINAERQDLPKPEKVQTSSIISDLT